jgi:5'-AMP-activated protein kinase catalytic alpha subunit
MSYIFQDLREEVNTNQNTDEIFQYYDIHKELGKGNFSVVHLGIDKNTGEACAIKFLNKKKFWSDPKIKDQVVREVEILRQIKHPNVVQYKDLYEGDTYVYLVLEYAEGGELFHKISRTGVSELEARTLFTQLLKAVNYLHSESIVHRDLKPENILLDGQGNIKISDFGLARFDATHMQSLCGTPHYVAPEVIRLGLGNSSVGYGKEVDMWSLGVSLYHMLTGHLPFPESDRMTLFNKIERGLYDFPHHLWCGISEEAKDLVKKLLDINPKTRLTAEQALKHAWIERTGGNFVNSRALQNSHLNNRKRTSEMVICNISDSISKPDTAGRKKRQNLNNRMSTVL